MATAALVLGSPALAQAGVGAVPFWLGKLIGLVGIGIAIHGVILKRQQPRAAAENEPRSTKWVAAHFRAELNDEDPEGIFPSVLWHEGGAVVEEIGVEETGGDAQPALSLPENSLQDPRPHDWRKHV